MYKRVDHIGIAVPDLEAAIASYETLLGKGPEHIEEVEDQKVKTAFFGVGETNLELLFPTSPESTIAKFIDKRGPGIHHICLQVTDLAAKLEDLKAQGFKLINETPIDGAHNKRVAFIHPKSTGGVLIELSEDR